MVVYTIIEQVFDPDATVSILNEFACKTFYGAQRIMRAKADIYSYRDDMSVVGESGQSIILERPDGSGVYLQIRKAALLND